MTTLASEIETARQALVRNDLPVAEAIGHALVAADPDNAAAASLLGAVALRRGDNALALQWTDRARVLGLEDFMVLNNAGEAYRRLGRLDEALGCFERAIKLDNTQAGPFYNLGFLAQARGDAPVAEHFFRMALTLNPAMGRASLALAELYREEGHPREADAEYVNALAAEPNNAHWRARRGTLRLENGDTVQAAVELSRATAMQPTEPAFHLDLARAQFELCREDEAVASLARGLALGGGSAAGAGVRAVAARYRHVLQWCAELGEEATGLRRFAQQTPLQLPPLLTEPPQAAAHFPLAGAVSPEAFVARAEGAEVLPDFSVLTRERSFLVAGLVNMAHQYPHRGRYAHHSADDDRVLLKLPGRATEIEEPCALLGGNGDHFAWMFEALPRLWALEQTPGADDLTLLVPAGLAEERRAMLEALGIGRGRLAFVPDDATLVARELHMPSLLVVGPWVSPVALQFVRKKLGGAAVADKHARRIYLSRGSMADGRLANEADLAATLAARGFETIDVAGLTPLALMAMLRDAEAVLAMDGEILANLPAAPLGTLVGAIVPNGLNRPRTYFVSALLGQRFMYLVGEPVFSSHPSLEHCDVVLPPDVLSAFLAKLRG